MGTWNIIVQPVRREGTNDRFAIWLFDPEGPHIRGPDGGEAHLGYLEDELREALIETYEQSAENAEALIQHAKIKATVDREK